MSYPSPLEKVVSDVMSYPSPLENSCVRGYVLPKPPGKSCVRSYVSPRRWKNSCLKVVFPQPSPKIVVSELSPPILQSLPPYVCPDFSIGSVLKSYDPPKHLPRNLQNSCVGPFWPPKKLCRAILASEKVMTQLF